MKYDSFGLTDPFLFGPLMHFWSQQSALLGHQAQEAYLLVMAPTPWKTSAAVVGCTFSFI